MFAGVEYDGEHAKARGRALSQRWQRCKPETCNLYVIYFPNNQTCPTVRLEWVKKASVGIALLSSLLLAKVVRAGECEEEGEEQVKGLDSTPVHRDVQKAAHLFLREA